MRLPKAAKAFYTESNFRATTASKLLLLQSWSYQAHVKFSKSLRALDCPEQVSEFCCNLYSETNSQTTNDDKADQGKSELKVCCIGGKGLKLTFNRNKIITVSKIHSKSLKKLLEHLKI